MTTPNLSLAITQDLFDKTNPFPVDFDAAWQWLDYDRKESAKRVFLSLGFTEGINFTIKVIDLVLKEERIYLSVDCLKMWAMMASTRKGKELRLYFLERERAARRKVLAAPTRVLPEKLEVVTRIDSLSNNDKLTASVRQLLIDSLINEYIDNTQR